MGHLINPVSFRLGVTSYWRSNYVHYFLGHTEYNYYFFSDKLLVDFFCWLLKINWFTSSIFSNFNKFDVTIKTKKNIFKSSNFLDLIFSTYNNNFESSFDTETKFNYIEDCSLYFIKTDLSTYIYEYFLSSYFLYFSNVIATEENNRDFKKQIWLKRRNLFPEVSHFNIYYSGFYGIKIFIYLQNRDYVNINLKEKTNELFFFKNDLKVFIYETYKDFFDVFLLKMYYPLFLKLMFLRFINWFLLLYYYFRYNNDSLDIFFIFNKVEKSSFISISLIIDWFSTRKFNAIIQNLDVPEFFSFSFFLYLKRIFFNRSCLNVKYKFLLKNKNFFLNNFCNFFIQSIYEFNFVFMFSHFINFYFKPMKIKLYIKLLENKNITSKLIYNFFIRNLRTRKPIGRLVNFIISDILLLSNLLGFKVLTSGRFTRKERAFYKWIYIKRTPLSTYNSTLDYFSGVYKSRFGICGLKIWLFKKIN